MGWVWRDDDEDEHQLKPSLPGGEISGNGKNPNGSSSSCSSDELCSTKRVVRSQCKTEQVEPGKFLKKCENTEEVLRECLGKPVEVLQTNKEYTEEDVTDEVIKRANLPLGKLGEDGGSPFSPFNFPGLQSDMADIERRFFGGMNSVFEAAEEMANGFFGAFGDFHNRKSPGFRRGIPIDDGSHSQRKSGKTPKPKEPQNGDVDLSGLAKDV